VADKQLNRSKAAHDRLFTAMVSEGIVRHSLDYALQEHTDDRRVAVQ
jgi:hypothetical protein